MDRETSIEKQTRLDCTEHNFVDNWNCYGDCACWNGEFCTKYEENELGEIFTAVIELFADQAHKSWSGWQQYVFDKSTVNDDGTYTIPKSLVDRWQRQIVTSYNDLSEEEKESDRAEAREYIRILKENTI